MRYILMLALVSAIAGFAHGKFFSKPRYQTNVKLKDPNITAVDDVVYHESTHPPVGPGQVDRPNDVQLFKKGEMVTCIYSGIFSWSDGDEFVKNVPIKCKVTQVADWITDNSEYGQSKYYQNFEVDCTKDIDAKSGGPGAGLVKNHKLNIKKRWYSTEECYHFVTQD